ncbi:family 1 glycosylhydrolase [Amycolatopsis mongoliensis]|uniref:Family 1 glycosylhydrolase n=1 Tax=Amycolatopsis mongoliensis TaxID=715475 RepID=A0A9Y2JJH9_9PSEU|nr:family 1 glycosylhydrolase [Amycolatopsis sp. 4-36]WIX98536.1 family 1 glycosylhydrolase [Amycolatopsis sp. 4-36]
MPNEDALSFPDGFLWGAATAGHQIEGNNVNSDYWHREYAPGTDVPEPSGDACDSYHRYREDIALLAGLGFTTYRFGIEWSRIEPAPGHVSRAELDHYQRMVAACHEAGLTPMVTLNHFTVPQWMHARGWWWDEAAPELFAGFTEAALPVLREGVEWVCTINEPNIVACIAGSQEGAANLVAHGLARPSARVSEQLVRAHRLSREVLAREGGIRSGWAVATQAIHALPGSEQVARDYSRPMEEFFLEASRGDDWLGVQAYTRTFVGPDGPLPPADDVEKTLTGWEYFPDALAIGVRNAWSHAEGVPIVVTENGIATQDDNRRVDYTRDALHGLHEAMSDGIDVRGYLHWSALDNYEWGRYSPTFGLIAVDRKTFRRTVKPSARWLGDIARHNALPRAVAA